MNREALAYWYFRLNGFMTIVNFVLHPRRSGGQRTDVDILGVRFPHRAEFPEGSESDEAVFTFSLPRPFFLIAEVTRGECKLNGPWTNPSRENLNAILTALGVYPDAQITAVANALYRNGRIEQPDIICSLFCVGNTRNPNLLSRYPSVPQKTWADVIGFVWRRFNAHRKIKTDIEQWDGTGRQLWKLSELSSRDFEAKLREECQLPAT